MVFALEGARLCHLKNFPTNGYIQMLVVLLAKAITKHNDPTDTLTKWMV